MATKEDVREEERGKRTEDPKMDSRVYPQWDDWRAVPPHLPINELATPETVRPNSDYEYTAA